MHHAIRLLVLALAGAPLVLALAASAKAGDQAAEITAVRVIEQRQIEIPDSRIISMSPDGRWLAAVRPAARYLDGELCVFAIETLEERACASLSGLHAGIRLEDVTWSPDGRHLAFTERVLISFIDGDLWLMDAANGQLTNLDDDGFSGPIPIFSGDWPDEPITVPASPAFSPDGAVVAFSRSTMGDREARRNTIAVVPVAGGPVADLATVWDEAGVVYYGIEWAPDASRIFYSVHHPLREEVPNGIWALDADGSDARLIVGSYLPDGMGPSVLDVAADGGTLLLYDPALAASLATRLPVYATADEHGNVTPLVPISPELPPEAVVTWAALSPDARYLLTLYRGTSPDHQVWVRDVAGTEEVPLVLDGLETAGPSERGLLPTWAPDGTVFLAGGPRFDQGTLLTLAIEGDREP
jgi:dipeptidyl aminopeptidase/acylaminoacyl peptidase